MAYYKIFKEVVHEIYRVYNQTMYEFHPYFTNDGSVGLYSPQYNDIYHSATGALTEAYEKFILPLDFEKLLCKDSVNILDICFGIGYNSKSFLNFIFENIFLKKFSKNLFHAEHTIETIYTNKIKVKENNNSCYQNIEPRYTNNIFQMINFNFINKFLKSTINCNVPIYTNKNIPKIYIKAVDNDKILSHLSPFIKTGEKNFSNLDLDFAYPNIEKFLKDKNKINNIKINSQVNYLILDKIINSDPNFLEDQELISIINNKKFDKYFDKNIKGIFNLYRNNIYKTTPWTTTHTFLHNIYYKYISTCYKNGLKMANLQDIIFELKNEDARKVILADNNLYDIIFLDAFTPSKCPCLWSYEFFKELYKRLSADGIILTYSTSAAVRAAMLEAGFYVGKIYNERTNYFTGSVCTKSNKVIKHELSEYELGLLKTKAGIFYRDKNLNASNEAIIAERKIEIKNSRRITSSSYKRNHKQEDLCYTT